MIHKQIFNVPENVAPDLAWADFMTTKITPFLEPFGFEQTTDIRTLRHTLSGAYINIRPVNHNNISYNVAFNSAPLMIPSAQKIIHERYVYHKANNVSTGTGILQLIIGEFNDTVWLTISGYNQIDTITGGVLLIKGENVINVDNANVYPYFSVTPLGQAKPYMANYDALPNNTHISSVVLASGTFIVRELEGIKGFASAEIQPYRLYEINGKQYLALPNRLMVES